MSRDKEGFRKKRGERIHVVYQPKQRENACDIPTKTKHVWKDCRETGCGAKGGGGTHGHNADTTGKCREWVTVKSHSPAPGRICWR